MATVAGIFCVTHNPMTPRLLADADNQSPHALAVRAGFDLTRKRLQAVRPDVILAVGGDHLNQWSTDNMPAFLVGKAPVAEGPFVWEREVGVPEFRATVAQDVALDLIRGGYDLGVDFAYSDEFRLDHSFVVPLGSLMPERPLPIVPLFCNAMIPPLPTARRYHQVGQAIRTVVAGMQRDLRVAVVCTGHLSLEIGGPRGQQWHSPAFDERCVDLIARGDVETLVTEMTESHMYDNGNATWGFLNYVLAKGLAGDRPADYAVQVPARHMEATPFFIWDAPEAAA